MMKNSYLSYFGMVFVYLLLFVLCFLDEKLSHPLSDGYTLSILPAIGGALITGASALGSGLMSLFGIKSSNNQNARINAENIAYDREKTQQQQAWEEDMYNKYQSIPAQVEQLRQAGINPSMAMSNPSVGQMPTSPAGGAPSSIPNTPANFDFVGDSMGAAVNTYYASQQQQALSRKTNAEAGLSEVDLRYAITNRMLDIAQKMSNLNKDSLQYRVMEENLRYLESVRDDMRDKQRWDAKTQQAIYENTVAKTEQTQEEIITSQLMRSLSVRADSREAARLKSDLDEAKARIDKMKSEQHLTDEQARHEASKMAETIIRTYGSTLDNVGKELEAGRTKDFGEFRKGLLWRTTDDLINWLTGSFVGNTLGKVKF